MEFKLLPDREAIRLMPVTDRDAVWLYQLACAFPERWPRLCARGTPPLPAFVQGLWRDAAALFRVDARIPGRLDAGQPLGIVGVYGLNQSSGVAWLERVDLPHAPRELMDVAVADLIDMARRTWPVHRVFVEYYDCGPSPISGVLDVESDGRLAGHGFFQGEATDLVYESVVLA